MDTQLLGTELLRIPKTLGRKKIKIQRIQDDRNRQVTFLKRKNGLLKKAMELGVLCDCEVSVVIFNLNNGKLFEYSSVDPDKIFMRYATYNGPSERRKKANFFDIASAKGGSNIPKFEPHVADAAMQAAETARRKKKALPLHTPHHTESNVPVRVDNSTSGSTIRTPDPRKPSSPVECHPLTLSVPSVTDYPPDTEQQDICSSSLTPRTADRQLARIFGLSSGDTDDNEPSMEDVKDLQLTPNTERISREHDLETSPATQFDSTGEQRLSGPPSQADEEEEGFLSFECDGYGGCPNASNKPIISDCQERQGISLEAELPNHGSWANFVSCNYKARLRTPAAQIDRTDSSRDPMLEIQSRPQLPANLGETRRPPKFANRATETLKSQIRQPAFNASYPSDDPECSDGPSTSEIFPGSDEVPVDEERRWVRSRHYTDPGGDVRKVLADDVSNSVFVINGSDDKFLDLVDTDEGLTTDNHNFETTQNEIMDAEFSLPSPSDMGFMPFTNSEPDSPRSYKHLQ